jgi:hypothetical protein
MLKPSSLRAHLTNATPDLKKNPDKLTVFVKDGRLVSAAAKSLSFEYRYTLSLVVLDYEGHPDAIMVPLLAWLKRNQIELFENTDLREKSIRFEVEYLNKSTLDLTIDVDLTERVIVQPGSMPTSDVTAKRYNITHAGEPPRVGVPTVAETLEVAFEGQVIASWDIVPDPDDVP